MKVCVCVYACDKFGGVSESVCMHVTNLGVSVKVCVCM